MTTVHFTPNLNRHIDCPDVLVCGATVAEALEQVFASNPRLRNYILDDQGRMRKHVLVFVGGKLIEDRNTLSDSLTPERDVFVMQALSGG